MVQTSSPDRTAPRYDQGWNMGNYDTETYSLQISLILHAHAVISEGDMSMSALTHYLTTIENVYMNWVTNFKEEEQIEMEEKTKLIRFSLIRLRNVSEYMNPNQIDRRLYEIFEEIRKLHKIIMSVKERCGLGLTRLRHVSMDKKLKNMLGL